MHTLPTDIEKGMAVFDSTHAHIGTVEDFKAGDEDFGRPGPESVTVSEAERDRSDPITRALAEVFSDAEEMPEEMRERLMRSGFVRIDADGLFASDRYITADQIAAVSNEGIMLNVTRDQLVKH